MKIQLKVIKADGTTEQYMHTKVMGAIGNALAAAGRADVNIAEQLAEVVTYHLYHKHNPHRVTSGEIFAIVKVVLASTSYEDAAAALTEHHLERRLKRSRIEVAAVDMQELADAEQLCKSDLSPYRSRWDKANIISDLVTKHGLSCQTARAIASMVEEKIFNMGLTLVSASLIKQLVLSDAVTVLRAQRQLQAI